MSDLTPEVLNELERKAEEIYKLQIGGMLLPIPVILSLISEARQSAKFREERNQVVDGVRHALHMLYRFDEDDQNARDLRHHLMGTITGDGGQVINTEGNSNE